MISIYPTSNHRSFDRVRPTSGAYLSLLDRLSRVSILNRSRCPFGDRLPLLQLDSWPPSDSRRMSCEQSYSKKRRYQLEKNKKIENPTYLFFSFFFCIFFFPMSYSTHVKYKTKDVRLTIENEKHLIIDDTKETIDLEFIYGVSVTDSELTLYVLWKQPVIETGSTRPAETQWERKTMSYQVTDENQEWINKLRKLTLPEHQATRVVAFVNPSSGRRGADTAWKNVVRPMLLQAGFIDSHLTVVMTESGGKTIQQAQQVAHELTQDTVLVVMGGDGTVHEVLNGLLSQPLPSRPTRVGVVPVGSGNAFAMGLGIDGVEHAVLRIIKGQTQNCGWMNVRLGQSLIQGSGWENEINYRPNDMKLFIVMSWGFHAQIVSKSRYLKYFMGNRRFSLVAMALLTFLQQYEGELVLKGAVSYNKEHHQFDKQSETIVVNDKFTYFVISKQPSLEKGFTIAPFASPLDDQMDIILLRNANANQLTEASMQAFQGGKHVDLDKVDYFKAKEVLLRVKDKTEICLDGEIHDLPSNGIVHLKGSNEPAFAVFV
ncbi:unnamed protein product [Rhizopus microsporus]